MTVSKLRSILTMYENLWKISPERFDEDTKIYYAFVQATLANMEKDRASAVEVLKKYFLLREDFKM